MKNLAQEMADIIAQHQWNQKYQELLQEAVQDEDVQQFLASHPQIKSVALQQDVDAIYEFVQAKSKSLAGYQPRLIWQNQHILVSYEPDQQLIAHKKAQAFKNKFQTIDMASDLDQADLDDFAQGDTGRQAAYLQALRFLTSYNPQQNFVPGLYLAGDFGVGKTYLLAAIAKKLVSQNTAVMLVHFPTFAVQMKNSINDHSVMDKIEQIKDVPILMLDDIGADSLSSWVRDEILGVILQYRMQEKLATFFSSNFSMADLQKHLAVNQRGDQEPIKAARIMERVHFLAQEVVVLGTNRRHQNH
ncbi:primosomal protein DnaI [Bombilactobacillus thymidiniphilus]|uniref:Primosomal protein DnaI n=1 Tax=Bombilactobacillus thymidiniphilus TaxID=2923363 RepID=A0ABY4PCW5_9LACO|nr:primosomal protein DnaI [Bombilactobacillus thymidiniphilus]UQS83356.1 primosomal protein DnaI [Bombilactobacillus thymidiniphilus]